MSNYLFFLTTINLFFRYHLVILHRGLVEGWLRVGWGFHGVNLSEPPANPLETPNQPPENIKQKDIGYQDGNTNGQRQKIHFFNTIPSRSVIFPEENQHSGQRDRSGLNTNRE